MRALLQLPVIRSLHQRQLLFPVVVAALVIFVLVQGALQKSEPAQALQGPPVPDTPPVEASRPSIIRADLEKTPLTYVSDYWAQLAEQTGPHLALIGEPPIPAVLVGPRLAVTTADAAVAVLEARSRERLTRAPATAAAAGDVAAATAGAEESGPFRLRGWDAGIGLALFDVTGTTGPAFTLTDPSGMPSGSYLGAVTLRPDGTPTITPGYLATTVDDEVESTAAGDLVVSMDLPSTVAVAAVVNLDGALVGLAYKTPAGHRVITATQLLSVIGDIEAETVCRGIEVADLDETVSTLMALQTGVLVEYVRAEAFDPEPSLRAGDVLLEWAGQPVQSADEFRGLYDAQEAGELVRYRVLRAGRRISGGTVMPGAGCKPLRPNPVRLVPYGMAVDWLFDTAPGPGWQVIAVAPDGPAAQVGIEEGDWLITVDRTAVDAERDRSLLERVAEVSGPLLVSVRRDNRVKLVAISPRLASDDE